MAKRGHGEGTIVKRSDGRWMAQVTTGHDAGGKLKRVTYYGKTRQEVAEKLAKAQHEKNTGAFVEPEKTTFHTWFSRWLAVYVKPKVRPASFTNYHDLARNHIIPALGNIPLQKLTTDAIQEFYNQKAESGRLDGQGGLSSRIIHQMHQVINGALKQAVRQKLIVHNPAEYTTRPGLKYKQMQPLDATEVNRYLEAVKHDRLYPAFLLEMTTGLRRGELLAVAWDFLDLAKGTLAVKRTLARVRTADGKRSALQFSEPKTDSSKRTIPLLPEVAAVLKEHKKRQLEERLFFGQAYRDNGLVFCTEDGHPLEPRNFHRKHTLVLKKAGLRHVRIHDLRHSFSTIVLQEGENPENLRDLLGHTRTSTTMDLYCHSTEEGKRKAVNRLRGVITL
ncbi:MAG: site-specific integrase [Peptococcaceae bacterium]|nr:MAG: site-specific integrase [Peptococcaceae bacterium]